MTDGDKEGNMTDDEKAKACADAFKPMVEAITASPHRCPSCKAEIQSYWDGFEHDEKDDWSVNHCDGCGARVKVLKTVTVTYEVVAYPD